MEALRSALQPVTHNLPGPIRDLGVSIIGERCYQALILDVDETNTECIKLAVSKGLGIGIVAASAVVKVPQILKLVRSRSASGVSFLSYLLETSAFLITLAYNFRNGFPFNTYGETALILAQNLVITLLVLNYSGRATAAALFVAALAASAVTLFAPDVLDMATLSYLQAGAGVLGVASKVPQIAAIWQEGGTGQLSAFAVRVVSCRPGRRLGTERTLTPSGDRSSTTSSARCPASSPRFRRWTTSSSCTASWPASPSMQCSPRRCCTTGTPPRPRRPPASNRRPADSPPRRRRIRKKHEDRRCAGRGIRRRHHCDIDLFNTTTYSPLRAPRPNATVATPTRA